MSALQAEAEKRRREGPQAEGPEGAPLKGLMYIIPLNHHTGAPDMPFMELQI